MSQHHPMTWLIAIIDWSSGRPHHQHFGSRRQPAFLFSVGSCGAALVKVTMTIPDCYDQRNVAIVASYHLGRFRSRADSVHRLPADTYVTISRDEPHHLQWLSCFVSLSTRQRLVVCNHAATWVPARGRRTVEYAWRSGWRGRGRGVRGQPEYCPRSYALIKSHSANSSNMISINRRVEHWESEWRVEKYIGSLYRRRARRYRKGP